MIIECFNKYTNTKFFWEYEDMQLKEAREENQTDNFQIVKRVSNKRLEAWLHSQSDEFRREHKIFADMYIVPLNVLYVKQLFLSKAKVDLDREVAAEHKKEVTQNFDIDDVIGKKLLKTSIDSDGIDNEYTLKFEDGFEISFRFEDSEGTVDVIKKKTL